jgi:hypothetical protein
LITRAGEWFHPRQAQLKTELGDDGETESSEAWSGADEGSGERSRRARAWAFVWEMVDLGVVHTRNE